MAVTKTYDKIAKIVKDLSTCNGEDVISKTLSQSAITQVDRQSIYNAYARLQSHEVVQSQLNAQSKQMDHMQSVLNLTHDAALDASINSSEASMNAQEAKFNSREASINAQEAAANSRDAAYESERARRSSEDAASAARSIYIPPR
jgi:hypothetical protein